MALVASSGLSLSQALPHNGQRMCYGHGVLVLRSENPKDPSRYIMEGDTFEVWGVVRFSVRDHDRIAG